MASVPVENLASSSGPCYSNSLATPTIVKYKNLPGENLWLYRIREFSQRYKSGIEYSTLWYYHGCRRLARNGSKKVINRTASYAATGLRTFNEPTRAPRNHDHEVSQTRLRATCKDSRASSRSRDERFKGLVKGARCRTSLVGSGVEQHARSRCLRPQASLPGVEPRLASYQGRGDGEQGHHP